jgi:hypothetical protein
LLYLGELALDLGENELREGARATLLVDADVDPPIFCDYRVRTQPILVVELAGEFGVCGWRLVGVRCFVLIFVERLMRAVVELRDRGRGTVELSVLEARTRVFTDGMGVCASEGR